MSIENYTCMIVIMIINSVSAYVQCWISEKIRSNCVGCGTFIKVRLSELISLPENKKILHCRNNK